MELLSGSGLLRFDPGTARLSIDYDRYHEVVGKLLAKVLELQYRGDKAAADEYIQIYGLGRKICTR